MADSAKQQPEKEAPPADAGASPWWKSLMVGRWLAAIIVVSLIVHAAVFMLLRKSGGKPAAPAEYTVGTFSFVSDDRGDSKTIPGKFDLHIRFVDDLDAPAHQRLVAHQYRVRESVENVLRKSHGLELTDPALARLKHEIQEKIDTAIDLRAVAEVIITDLSVQQPQIDGPNSPVENAVRPAQSTPTAITPAAAADKPADSSAVSIGY
jgi:flagellar basal body-associated protein FliL